jgi:hypothetical protein
MMRTRPIFLAVACLAPFASASLVRADDPKAPLTATPSDPIFRAVLTDGTAVSGQIRKLNEASGVALAVAGGGETTIAADQLVKLTREGASPPAANEGGAVVLFPDGDRLARCIIGQAGDATLEVNPLALGGPIPIPLDALLGLIFKAPGEPEALDSVVAAVRTEPRKNAELLWLTNGDRVLGGFLGLDDKKIRFQPSTGKIELDRGGLQALGFDPGLVNYLRPEGPYLELTLVDGSRLGVTKARVEGGQVVGTSRFGAEIRLPLGELARVHRLSGSVVYLSDREPTATRYVPYFGSVRPYRRGATVAGSTLRVGGQSYDRGLGTQSKTYLIYRIEPGWKRFQATIGLDDQAGPLGSVVFSVMVDDKVRLAPTSASGGDAEKSVDIDLQGGRFLVLITDFGERGDVQDLADWVEARVIR